MKGVTALSLVGLQLFFAGLMVWRVKSIETPVQRLTVAPAPVPPDSPRTPEVRTWQVPWKSGPEDTGSGREVVRNFNSGGAGISQRRRWQGG